MLGAVYERSAEIGVYSSVGLFPRPYLIPLYRRKHGLCCDGGGIRLFGGADYNLLMTHYDLLGGMFLNYSSLSAITSTLIVMATVVLSTLYPARKAASMSVPDVTRRWKFPEPNGDLWTFNFPFTLARNDALGSGAYLHRVFFLVWRGLGRGLHDGERGSDL